MFSQRIYEKGEYIFSIKVLKNNKEVGIKFDGWYSYLGNSKMIWEYIDVNDPKKLSYIGCKIVDNEKGAHYTDAQWIYYDSKYKSFGVEDFSIINNNDMLMFPPPKTQYFEVLNFSPALFIRKNGKKKWKSSFIHSSHHFITTDRWKEWEGDIKVVSVFLADKIKPNKIKSLAKSVVGESSLDIAFDSEKGVTQWRYKTIEGDEIILDLIEIRQ